MHSNSAFALLDQWVDCDCVAALEGGFPDKFERNLVGKLSEYPLGSLLTLPVNMQQYTSLPLLKALLLAGLVSGRPEMRLLVQLSEGARLSTKRDAWKCIMPASLKGNPTFADALNHCRSHAETRLRTPTGLSAPEISWLEGLKQWCDLLSEPISASSLDALEPITAAIEPRLAHESASPAWQPCWLVFDEEVQGDEPVADEGWESGESALPQIDAPEALPRVPRARPGRSNEPESRVGAEARRARTGFRSALENQYLPWVNDQLSPDDCAALVAELKAALTVTDADISGAVGLLALAHVTGQMVEQAAGLALQPCVGASYLHDHRTLMHWVLPQPGAWTPLDHLLPLLHPKATHVRLVLPNEVSGWLVRHLQRGAHATLGSALGLPGTDGVAGARDWLAGLRRRTGGLQTLARVEAWLSNALYQTRPDHVPPQLICATNLERPCPAAYYRAYRVTELTRLHQRTLTEAGWSMPEPEPFGGVDGVDARWIGSNLNPRVDEVRASWATMSAYFEAVVGDTTRPLHERHNAREYHEVMLLMFQTLHRVVSDPVESLELIDLATRRIAIADKQQGDTRAHRLVPLSSLAARQCEEHIEHVCRLTAEIGAMAPQTAARLNAMLNSPGQRAAPFRFLLDERYQIVRLTPARLRDAVAPAWRLPLNLARHFTSTWLLQRGIGDDALCSLLGHHDLGTQNLSLLSPCHFEALFGAVRPLLDELAAELGLRSIPTFLAAGSGPHGGSCTPARTVEMSFGYRRRDQARGRQLHKVQAQVNDWISEQLVRSPNQELAQHDVAELFERVRQASSNPGSYWAHERLEALRDALLALQEQRKCVDMDFPAIPLAVRDLGHQCPLHGLAAARWLRRLRGALRDFWHAEFQAWRAARTSVSALQPEVLVLTLVVDSLLLDPEVWACWAKGEHRLELFVDDALAAWVRTKLPGGNSRLYPVRRDLAEMFAGVPSTAWNGWSLEAVARLCNELAPVDGGMAAVRRFDELLERVLTGSAADAPGLVLGYASGAHGSVSPEAACLERERGLPPTRARAQAGHDGAPAADDTPELVLSAAPPCKRKGQITEEALFRQRMSQALRLMERSAAARGQSRNLYGEAGASRSPGRQPRPVMRFVQAVEAQSDDLLHSSMLPRMCSLAAQWIYSLGKLGQKDGSDYAPKTLLNYWYSWALRVMAEFGPIDPAGLSADELEGLYLEIIEEAEVENRQHLYPPMRSLHRYLVDRHGVCEIDWFALRQVTGQGLSHVNANLVHEPEYFRALELLCGDDAVPARVRSLQAAVLVLLYRFGLRIAECLGLRDCDVVFDGEDGRWSVLVRANRYRDLKTENARRRVVQLEAFDDREHEVLHAWTRHVRHYASERGEQPLFACGTTDRERAELFPRHLVTLRVTQALRAACGDPSIRLHHCRHAFATRILRAGLAHANNTPGDKSADPDTAGVLRLLTSHTAPTRRFVWAVAAMLGHASPATTLQTYFHGGHRLLRAWCESAVWTQEADADAAEWFAFASGTSLKTMQQSMQRARAAGRLAEPAHESSDPTTVAARARLDFAISRWSRVAVLGQGDRVALPATLPALVMPQEKATLHGVDQIIDHARRHGRIDGLAQQLHVAEAWVEQVLRAASTLAARHRTTRTPQNRWWLEASDVRYHEHERTQVQQALQRLEGFPQAEREATCDLIERYLVPASRMVVIEDVQSLEKLARLLECFIDDKQDIVLLVPAKQPSRSARQEEHHEDGKPAQWCAEKIGARVPCRESVELEKIAALRARAEQLGLGIEIHGRVAGARDGTHNWLRPSDRVGLSVKKNKSGCARSAKVCTRVLAAVAVAWRAQKLLEQAD